MASEAESRFFRAWTETVLRWKWLFLLITFAITGFFGFQAKTKLEIDPSADYFSKGSESRQILDAFHEDFGNDTWHLIMVEGEVFSLEYLDRLKALHQAMEVAELTVEAEEEPEALEEEAPAEDAPADDAGWDEGGWGDDEGWGDEGWGGESGGSLVEEVVSLVNARQTVSEGGAVRVRGFLDRWPTEAELPGLKATALADPALVGQVVGAEGTHAVVLVRTQVLSEKQTKEVHAQLATIAAEHNADGFRVENTGMPALNAALTGQLTRDMRVLVGAAFLVMSVVLGGLFRNAVAVISPLIVVGMSAIWALGAMAMYGVPVTLLTNILPAFLACVGLGDSVHVLSVYRDARVRGDENHRAVVHAIASTAMPILFTTLTTAMGLISFRFASTEAIQELGMFGAWGVMVALLHSVVFLPIALSLGGGKVKAPAKKGERKRDFIDALLAATTRLSQGPGKPARVLGAAVVVALISGFGMTKLAVYHNPLEWLPEDDRTRMSLDEFDARVGGTASLNVLLDADGEYGVKDLELLQGVERLQRHLDEFVHPRTNEQIVTSSTSLVDVIKETNRALHEGDQAHYALPDTQRGVSDNLFLFENAGPQALRQLATADFGRSHLSLRLRWMDATSYLPLTQWLDEGIERFLPDAVQARPAGSVYTIISVISGLIDDLLRSFSVAILTVTVMMILLLKTVRLGLIAMLPNLVPIFMVMGMMGYTGIPIDLANLLIASIVIGVSVDYTIHYIHQWRVVHAATGDCEAGIAHALDHAGRALVGSAMILTGGFAVYLASSMVNVQRFGVLVGLACLFALFSNLVIAPALLRLVFGEARESSRTAGAVHDPTG